MINFDNDSSVYKNVCFFAFDKMTLNAEMKNNREIRCTTPEGENNWPVVYYEITCNK
jgi:hypothetical protein